MPVTELVARDFVRFFLWEVDAMGQHNDVPPWCSVEIRQPIFTWGPILFIFFLIRPSMWKKCGVKHCLNTVVKSVAAIKNGSQYRSSWCWERIVVSCSADYMVRGFQQRKTGSTGHVWLSIVWDIQTTYKIHRNSMFLFTFIVFLLVHWTSVIKTINDDTATRFFRCWNSLTMF